jgi:O-antigen/teichoic acid export membrane protein
MWNVVNGMSGAVIAVVVPPFLTKALSPEAYGAWALTLQMGTYVALFGFGLQVAVGRFIAHYEARGDIERRDGIVATAFWTLTASAAVGFAILVGLAANVQMLVPKLSADILRETQLAIILVALALAANLPASVFAAVFIGRQESKVAAVIQGSGRLAIAAGLIAVGPFGNIALLGLVYVCVSACTIAALWYAWRTRTLAPTVRFALTSRKYLSELWDFCVSITLWSLAMLLVNGLDLIIVGRFDYQATAYYAVSIALMSLVVGTLSSLSNALVPAAARIPDADRATALPDLLLRSTRLIAGLALLIAAPLIFAPDIVLGLWLGSGYAAQASTILAILAVAALLRNTMLPYVTIAIGLGEQKRMTRTPLVEAGVTLALSLLLARQYGVIGVAAAKIAGGAVGVLLMLRQHVLEEQLGGMRRLAFLRETALRTLWAGGAVAVGMGALHYFAPTVPPLLRLLTLGFISVSSVWMLALHQSDRRMVVEFLRRRLPV